MLKGGNSDQKTLIRLEVFSDRIIRVSATAGAVFEKDSSLVVTRKDVFTDWTTEEDEKEIRLLTAKLVAHVDKSTGTVEFSDRKGKKLLKEKAEGGKQFVQAIGERQGLYSVRQVFESPSDEAFYGLGAHQHGYTNYKGKDVDLTQHNIVDVIPFLYSNKNYGILWDNYSVTRFGDPRDYKHLSGLRLFDKGGIEGGLTVSYFVDGKLLKEQKENVIDFQYLETPGYERLPKEVNNEKGRIIWEGYLSSDTPGRHKYQLYASSYFRLWLDDKLVMDKWRQNWNPWSNPFEIEMKPGEKHKIRIDWIPNGGYMSLTWLDPLPGNEQQELSLFSEVGPCIDYYFIYGENADEVISGYRHLTGKATMIPKWAFGFWQSRERYKTQDEIVETVRTFRNKEIPLDNIVLDWNYWPEDQWGSHLFDSLRFRDPAAMNLKLHDSLHTNIMISVWPKFYPGTKNGREMRQKGWLFENNLAKKRKDWIAKGYENTFYDVFHPGARNLFWQQVNREIFSKGFDALWLDATEPDMHSNLSIAERKLNMTPNHLGTGSRFFNAYSFLNSKGIYEEQRKTYTDNRVFILTRSAFAGQQAYGAATWSGDIASRWSDMKDQIAAGIHFSVSGIPYWTMDIGGFAVEKRYGAYGDKPTAGDLDEWREMNARWYQFGAFCPLFRVHGQYPYREIYHVAPENHPAYKSMLYYDKLRYRLMPYIYSLAGHAYHRDGTMIRGLFMDFSHDDRVINIGDQYMFGPWLMVCPVTEYKARTRKVYLPSDTGWYDFYTGRYYEGGRVISADAPYEKMPLMIKAGAVLPLGQDMMYTGEKPDTLISLYVFEGADGSFDLYGDEGNGYGYEKGAFSLVKLEYRDADGKLVIGDRKGQYPGLPERVRFKVFFILQGSKAGIDEVKRPTAEVIYTGKRIEIVHR